MSRLGVTEKLARLSIETDVAGLPVSVIESAKMRILDTLAVMVAGARHSATMIALELVRHMGGNPTASIVGHPDRSSSPLAAFVNGVAAHAYEYCDFSPRAYTHLSACVLPGSLPVAEEVGASGRDLLAAFAVGFEVGARIGRGMAPHLFNHGWHPNAITGALGVSAACARLFRLDVPKTRMALGLAVSQGSGVRKNVGSMGKAFHHGHGSRCGVFAAMLAQRGYQVDPDAIEGEGDGKGHERFGLVETFCGIGNYDMGRMTEALGQDWELDHGRTVVRLHPTSTPAQSAIDAMLDLARRHGPEPESIARIDLEVTRECMTIACYHDAPNSHRAKFCLRYMMAVALIDKAAGIAQFTDARVRQPDVQALMQKVNVSVPEDFERHRGTWGENNVSWGETRLRITLHDGTQFSTTRSHARGYPEEPATWADLEAKFHECADGILPAAASRDVIGLIHDLERLPNLNRLTTVLTRSVSPGA
ncbi:MAG TPA: MmgE/PrpD family protein [Thermodesulfobacteriota bacterium]